jgi:hypothetical protein
VHYCAHPLPYILNARVECILHIRHWADSWGPTGESDQILGAAKRADRQTGDTEEM